MFGVRTGGPCDVHLMNWLPASLWIIRRFFIFRLSIATLSGSDSAGNFAVGCDLISKYCQYWIGNTETMSPEHTCYKRFFCVFCIACSVLVFVMPNY